MTDQFKSGATHALSVGSHKFIPFTNTIIRTMNKIVLKDEPMGVRCQGTSNWLIYILSLKILGVSILFQICHLFARCWKMYDYLITHRQVFLAWGILLLPGNNAFVQLNLKNDKSWWRHQMETFFALLAICAGNSPVPGEFPTQRPVTRSFDVYFDLRPNKRLSKHSWGWWFETLSSPLWCHRNVIAIPVTQIWLHDFIVL